MEKSSSVLVQRAKKGDAEAFACLYEEIYKDLYHFAFYILNNPADAQDVVSDAVTDAFASIGRLRSDDAFRSWMFKILSNKCKKRLREYALHPTELSDTLAEQLAAPESVHDTDTQLQIRMLFGELPDTDRMIIAMHIFAGYTSREIARQLHMNENTVRSREHRSLEKLKKKLTS